MLRKAVGRGKICEQGVAGSGFICEPVQYLLESWLRSVYSTTESDAKFYTSTSLCSAAQ